MTEAPPRWIAGVDIGGTNLRAGLVPFAGGEVAGMTSGPTRAGEGAERVVARVAEMTRAAMEAVGAEGGEVAGVGIGAPGPLDRERGVVLRAPNLGWRETPLRDMAASRFGLPVAVDNDANCAAFGEWWQGAGRGAQRLVGLTLGTGIGGGVVLDGELYRGASGAAGEVGHMSVHFAGRPCACGSRGCVEAYASGPSMAARALEAIAAGASGPAEAKEGTSLAALAERDPAALTAEAVCDAAADGDACAARIVEETARILAVAVANLMHFFNPDRIVIGGGVAAAGDLLFRPLRDEVRRRTFHAASDACRIVPAELPGTAGIVGAAGVLKRTLRSG